MPLGAVFLRSEEVVEEEAILGGKLLDSLQELVDR